MKHGNRLKVDHCQKTVAKRHASMSSTGSNRPNHAYAHYEGRDAGRPSGVRCYEMYKGSY